MDTRLQLDLFGRYPQIFAERALPDTETAMCRGIECGDGWFHLIDALCARLQWDTDHEDGPQAVATQVKEKFGTLRFRVRGATERQHGMLDLATELSGRICDQCGAPGVPGDVARLRATRCTAHAGSDAR